MAVHLDSAPSRRAPRPIQIPNWAPLRILLTAQPVTGSPRAHGAAQGDGSSGPAPRGLSATPVIGSGPLDAGRKAVPGGNGGDTSGAKDIGPSKEADGTCV